MITKDGVTTTINDSNANENKIKEIKKMINDLNYLLGQNYFSHDGLQNYLIFKTVKRNNCNKKQD